MNPLADLARVPSLLTTRRLGRSLELRESTVSTMDDARRALELGAPEGHVVVADTQSAGRGTHGRVWSSPSGSDLYLSSVARPEVPIDVLPTMTLAVGLGVCRAVAHYAGDERTRIKWPNDVLVDGRKVAGILVETRASSEGIDGVIVGIGLNCNRRHFDPEVGERAISLALACHASVDRAEVLARVLAELEQALEAWVHRGPAATAHEVDLRLAYLGGRARLDGAEVTVLGVGPDGSLRVEQAGQPRSVHAGRLEPAAP